MPDKVRVDQWLWAVRIFKSRTLSNKMCKKGNVKIDEVSVKPAQDVEVGDEIVVHKNGFNYRLKVQRLIKKRVGAPIARKCYLDITPEEELNKYEAWFINKSKSEFREKGKGRPTKKERREIEAFKKRLWNEDGSIPED